MVEHGRGGDGFLATVGGDLGVQCRYQQPTGERVLEAVEQLAHDAKRRRHDTARHTGVNSLAQDGDAQHDVDQAA